MLLKYAPECWKTRLRVFQIWIFSAGAFPWNPLEGHVATQAQFTSAAYSVQIRHLLYVLITTMEENLVKNIDTVRKD